MAETDWNKQAFAGDIEGALSTVRLVVTAFPTDTSARFDMAMILSMLGQIDEACVEFRRVLEIEPTHWQAKQQLVLCR